MKKTWIWGVIAGILISYLMLKLGPGDSAVGLLIAPVIIVVFGFVGFLWDIKDK